MVGVGGTVFSIALGVAALTLRASGRWRVLAVSAGVLWAASLGWLPLGWAGRPHARQDIRIKILDPPAVDVSGAWRGSWTDPKQRSREPITLNLEQSGN